MPGRPPATSAPAGPAQQSARAERPGPPAQGQPRGRSGISPRTRTALRGGGLLAIALVAGLVWWLIRYEPVDDTRSAAPQQDPLTSGEFDYTRVAGPEISAGCAANAYGDVVGWFRQHPCEQVHRSLYETRAQETRALVSVVVVTMPGQTGAKQLKVTTDTEGTGNVNDLVRDGTANLPGAPNVATGEYASRVVGDRLTIVEAQFFADTPGSQDLLGEIAHDALRLSAAAR